MWSQYLILFGNNFRLYDSYGKTVLYFFVFAFTFLLIFSMEMNLDHISTPVQTCMTYKQPYRQSILVSFSVIRKFKTLGK